MKQWIQLSSGRGPAECCWVLLKLLKKLEKDAKKHQIDCQVLEKTPLERHKNLYQSILLSAEYPQSQKAVMDQFIKRWQGTIQWIAKSPFRPRHKRRNWFVGVQFMTPVSKPKWSEKDIRIETCRASGPGGQRLNKVETAVRVTHLPSKRTFFAQEERSQAMNRQLALARLAADLKAQKAAQQAHEQKTRWQHHNQLERGNPVQVFRV
ncbi:peptide chain release factor H [Magnetococcales bacterium HHB-1]